MKKVKITVPKTTLDKELALKYGAEGLATCPLLPLHNNAVVYQNTSY